LLLGLVILAFSARRAAQGVAVTAPREPGQAVV
jgi:hypothetical protein